MLRVQGAVVKAEQDQKAHVTHVGLQCSLGQHRWALLLKVSGLRFDKERVALDS
jgi:hypothetical protein